MGKKVWLDIDNTSEDGRDPYDRLLAVVYLEDLNETNNITINVTHPFNRLLVDAGYAVIKNFTDNEFNPDDWWAVIEAGGLLQEISDLQSSVWILAKSAPKRPVNR